MRYKLEETKKKETKWRWVKVSKKRYVKSSDERKQGERRRR